MESQVNLSIGLWKLSGVDVSAGYSGNLSLPNP